jgi:hypothetical protein
MYRPNPDCPRTARTGPYRAMTRRWIRRRVILTILLVMARSFGGVTRSAGWEPARAGHDVATGAGQGRVEGRTRLARGPRPADLRAGMRGSHPVAARTQGTVAARTQGTKLRSGGRPPGPLIGWIRLFPMMPVASGGNNSGLFSARLCARFPECRPGRRPRSRDPRSSGSTSWPRRRGPGRREPSVAAILLSSPASCRGPYPERASALVRAVFDKVFA